MEQSCPFCAEIIKSDAVKCRYCGEFLDEDVRGARESVVVEEKGEGCFLQTMNFGCMMFWVIVAIVGVLVVMLLFAPAPS